MNNEPGSIVVLIVEADNNTDLRPDVYVTSRGCSVTLVKKASINVPIKQATTAEKKNASEGGRGFLATWSAIPPTRRSLQK